MAAILFVLAIVSAVLSTIDRAILAPAGVIAENLLRRLPQQRFSDLALDRICVVGVAAASLGVGTLLWLAHLAIGWEWFAEPWLRQGLGVVAPVGLTSAACALIAFVVFGRGEGSPARPR